MMNWLDRLARWWLNRRGRYHYPCEVCGESVLPPYTHHACPRRRHIGKTAGEGG